MSKIDKLLEKARGKTNLFDRLEQDNPYIGKTFEELTDMLSGDHYTAPPMRTREWDKFMYAMMHAVNCGDWDGWNGGEGNATAENGNANGSTPDAGQSGEHGAKRGDGHKDGEHYHSGLQCDSERNTNG